MHFIRPVGQPQAARLGEEAGEHGVAAHAHAAVNLHRHVHHRLQHVRGDDLDRTDLGHGGDGTDLVDLPGRIEGEQARLVDSDAGLGDALAVATEAQQRLAEGSARHAAVDHQIQRLFGSTQHAHAVVDAARPKATLGDLEATAQARNHIAGRHAHIVEMHLAVAVWRVIVAEDRQHAFDLDAGRVQRHQHHRVLAVAAQALVGREAHEDADLAAWVAHAGAPPLLAVDDDVVAVEQGRRLHVGGIAAGDIRLGHEEHAADITGQQRREPLGLLLLGAVFPQHFHVAGVGRVAVEQLRGHEAAAGFFGDRSVFKHAQSATQLGVGQEEIPQAFGLGLGFQRLDMFGDFPLRPVAANIAVVDAIPVLLLDRQDVFLDEMTHPLDDVLALGAGLEVHFLVSSVCVARSVPQQPTNGHCRVE